MKLPAGGTYLSRIVINHERGAHSGLEQPTVLLATPVSDRQGRALGVVVINVGLNGTFALLAADLPKEFQLFPANGQGDFLIYPDRSKTFGFDRGRRVLVQDEFAATRDLVDGKADQVLIEAKEGRYVEAPMVAAFIGRRVQTASDESALILGLAQPLAAVLDRADKLGAATLQIVIGFCLACVLLAVPLARAVTRPINSMSVAVQRFADQHRAEGLPLERRVEIGVLACSFNRMQDQIRQQLAELRQSRRGLEHLALMFIDLDKFKPINDSLGHAVGDLLLEEIAGRVRKAIRDSDTAARIGGDEFVAARRAIQQSEDAMTVAEKVRLAILEPFAVGDRSVAVSASIGIALYPDDGADMLELSQHADEAMYRAKQQRRDTVAFYQAAVEASPTT
ncbi:MAG: hypothetical protein A3H93_04520 [Rhodocyclales bacterium RIFCSPLOWO2_02_FULL_63_24]|nr:MAG: hypothetical protein A3H93_04520 [Rhodocyclales bacterium RIFCSPLOWO2_02_FULL_63_24]